MYEDIFKLSDVNWAISKNIGVMHPYVLLTEKKVVYDVLLDRLMEFHGSIEDVYNRRFIGGDFEIATTPMVYVSYIKTPNGLGELYESLPTQQAEETDYEFMHRVYDACTQIEVTASKLKPFIEALKNNCKVGEETSVFQSLATKKFGYD